MVKTLRMLSAVIGGVLAVGVMPAAAIPPVPAGAPFTTDNVTYHGTIPLDAPGVGGEVVERDGKRYFYVTGAYGLSIYDVTNPLDPGLAGHLVFPHSQNEDLKVSVDGKRAVIAADGSLPFSPNDVTTGVHIIDTSDVANPRIVGSTGDMTGPWPTGGAAEHTVACADAGCTFIYGSSTGNIYDATDPADITVVGKWNVDREGKTVPSRHALNRDPSGLLISDSTPRLVLDTVGVVDPSATPDKPVVLAQGGRSAVDTRLQHNNIRPDAEQWRPRTAQQPVQRVPVTPGPRSKSATDVRPLLRPGEIFIGQAESNINPTCANGGGLSTWSMANFDKGAELEQLELFQPVAGTYNDGNPATAYGGCSGHWFTESDGIVAASWYEHGVRFFEIDKTVGTITEIGYYQPVVGMAASSYWITDEVVYSVDNYRGIDILSFDRDAPRPTQAELVQSWLRSLGSVSVAGSTERLLCRLAVE